MRTLLALLLLAPVAASAADFQSAQNRHERVRDATSSHAREVEQAFRDAGAAWPTRGVHLRGFKAEGELELWAAPRSGARWVRVRTFPICAASGVLGPKRQSGDLQVPEGFYVIDRFNPQSRFHLSLGIDYPNGVDRARRVPGASLGGDIFIHGGCATIGCLPLRDGPMSWLYVATVAARDHGQRSIPVHLFPCRLDDATCQARLAEAGAGHPELVRSWAQLQPGYDAFLAHGRPPRITATRAGEYVLRH